MLLFTKSQRDIRPVRTAFKLGALKRRHRKLGIELLDVGDLGIVDESEEPGRHHRVRGLALAAGDFDNSVPIDRVRYRGSDFNLIEWCDRNLRRQKPDARVDVANEFAAHLGIVADSLEVWTRNQRPVDFAGLIWQ